MGSTKMPCHIPLDNIRCCWIRFLLWICVIVCSFSRAASVEYITVSDTGNQTKSAIEVKMRDGQRYLSVSGWVAALKLTWEWDFITGIADIHFRDHQIRLGDGVKGIMIDGRFLSLAWPVFQDESGLWVPFELFSKIVDPLWEGDLTWDASNMSLRTIGSSPEQPGSETETIDRQLILVLDPGHGGKDTGCRSPTNSLEKDITLKLVERLARIVEDRLGARVILTRSGDYDVTSIDRVVTGNQSQADLFISIHISPPEDLGDDKWEIYWSGSSNNQSELDRAIYLWDDVSPQTAAIVSSMIDRMGDAMLKASQNSTWERKWADLKVLKGLSIPGFLVEFSWSAAFYGNVTLDEDAGLGRVIEALFDGIKACLVMS